MRVLVSMSGGFFTYGMARGVLMIVNGQVFMACLRSSPLTGNERNKNKIEK